MSRKANTWRWWWQGLVLGACMLLPGPEDAGAQPSVADHLPLAHPAHPWDAERLAERVGDARLFAALQANAVVSQRWAALQTARYWRAPEIALPVLVQLSAGCDPHLAPLAAQVAWRIVAQLTRQDLARREAQLQPLRQARQAFGRLARQKGKRADIQALAKGVHGQLGRTLGVGE